MRETSANRDDAIRRLRRTTSVLLAGAGALVAAFAALAAKALPGHQAEKPTHAQATTTSLRATPPPLIAAHSAATPSAPAAPPAPTQTPPVVVSGGT
jgi:hypothetical protein